MALGRSCLVLWVCVVAGAGWARGQAPEQERPLTMISGTQFSLQGFAMYVRGEPFSLVETTTHVRVGPDGTERKSEGEERVFRDEDGRFRMDSGRIKDGAFEVRRVVIFDPVALTSIAYMPPAKTARLTHVRPRTPPTAESKAKLAEQAARSEAWRREHPESGGEEALGTQVIAGEPAEGMRVTTVFPAQDGRAAMQMVTETWMSPDLQIPLLTKTDDTRSGKTTRVVTEVRRREPDPKLFQLPAGYTVEEERRPMADGRLVH